MTAVLRWRGLARIDVGDDADAGAGRRVWLAANVPSGARVVDLGGTGGMLAGLAADVVGFDDLSGFGPGHRLEAEVLVGDLDAPLPFLDGAYDVAVLAEVLEHVRRPWAVLAEAARVAPLVLVTTPFENRWGNAAAFHVPGHVRFYTPEIFADHCRRAGLAGDVGLLEFGTFSFFVAVLAPVVAGAPPTDRFMDGLPQAVAP